MRATMLLNRSLIFVGTRARDVEVTVEGMVVATVALTARKKLSCPRCLFTAMAGYDTRWAENSWRNHHNYLTLVSDHTTSKIGWGPRGRTRPP